jgi:TonB family protein
MLRIGWAGALFAVMAVAMTAGRASASGCARLTSPASVVTPPALAGSIETFETGRADVRVWLDAQSHVTAAAVVSSWYSSMNAQAVQLARNASYRTALVECVPVPSSLVVPIHFAPNRLYASAAYTGIIGRGAERALYVSLRRTYRIAPLPVGGLLMATFGPPDDPTEPDAAILMRVHRFITDLERIGVSATRIVSPSPRSVQVRITAHELPTALRLVAAAGGSHYQMLPWPAPAFTPDRAAIAEAFATAPSEARVVAQGQQVVVGRLLSVDVSNGGVAWYGDDYVGVCDITFTFAIGAAP